MLHCELNVLKKYNDRSFFRYREHVIGACRNSNIEVVDGKTVEPNSRIMMKNLVKMRESSEVSRTTSHSRTNITSRTSISTRKSSRNTTSNIGKRRTLQTNSHTNGGNNLLTPSTFENTSSKFDAQIASPSTSLPLSKRNESSISSMTNTSSISTMSSMSENISVGFSSSAQEKGHGLPSKRTSAANLIRVPASIEES